MKWSSRACEAASKASMDIKRDAQRRGRRDQRRGHRQVPGHQSGRVAAAHHRHLDRAPRRRGRAGHRARLRPAVQHGDAQRPPDARRGRLRQRRPGRDRRRGRAAPARSTSPSSPPKRSAASRSTRPARPHVPSGGIGATINILTDTAVRPRRASSPTPAPRASTTESSRSTTTSRPEVSGIFSFTNDDKTWGVGLSASYQKRHGGSVQATENDWNIQRLDRHHARRCARRHGDERAGGRPALRACPTTCAMPSRSSSASASTARPWCSSRRPTALTLTLDYTYSTNEITENRGEQTHVAAAQQQLHRPRVRHRRRGGHAGLHPRNRRRARTSASSSSATSRSTS